MTQIIGCEEDSSALLNEEQLYRPNLHFTPNENWMNDPNGMFYYKDKFHLFFQHNPNDNVWGPMHWGHATSKDGISWQEHDIALYPDKNGTIYSGSAVVDHENTSGFGSKENPPIVAIFTNHSHKKQDAGQNDYETQGIAYSLDEGMTWTKYENNPVIENPGTKDFRDPKVFWHNEQEKWILVLAVGQEVQFFASSNLKQWQKLSSFGEGIGNHKGVWECPDLFQLPVQGMQHKKWVLLVSINPGGPNGGSATQYFIGDFDGDRFIIDPAFADRMNNEHSFWIDFGRDNYAGVTYNNIETEKGERLLQGWMSNWQYASKVPTSSWRSAMTLIRKISLVPDNGSYNLVTSPYIPSKKTSKKTIQNQKITNTSTTLISDKEVPLSATQINIEWEGVDFEFLLSNALENKLKIGFHKADNTFYIDRREAGKTDFSKKFATTPSVAPRKVKTSEINLTMILDKTSVELFYDNGLSVITEIFFLEAPFEEFSIVGDGILKQMEAYSLKE